MADEGDRHVAIAVQCCMCMGELLEKERGSTPSLGMGRVSEKVAQTLSQLGGVN